MFLLIEGTFFICSLIFFRSIKSCSSISHWTAPGILLQFLELLLRDQLQHLVYFINFFMSEAMVVLGVAETVQGDILKERLYVRDVIGMGLSAFRAGRIPAHLKEGNK